MKKEDIHLSINGNRIILSERNKILSYKNVIMDKTEPYVSDVYLALFTELGCSPWISKTEKYSIVYYGASKGLCFGDRRITSPSKGLDSRITIEEIRSIVKCVFEEYEKAPKWSGNLFNDEHRK